MSPFILQVPDQYTLRALYRFIVLLGILLERSFIDDLSILLVMFYFDKQMVKGLADCEFCVYAS